MSASAPVFNPSRPVAAAGSGSKTKTEASSNGVSGTGDRIEEDTEDAAESMQATSSLAAAAIAASRVTKPLPNSRRPGVSGNMAPVQASVPKSSEEKENKRRLIVVLSQVRGRGSAWVQERDHVDAMDVRLGEG
jgi:rRNA small subunit pseudouridine methyltransferase Nep1